MLLGEKNNTKLPQSGVTILPADSHWMQRALSLATIAAERAEVPVAAILVDKNNTLIGEGYNQPIALGDPTAHAEIIALREAGKTLSNYRLVDTCLYVTLEPCLMCVAAMVHARIGRVVFGALDPKSGGVVSCLEGFSLPQFNHRVDWQGGVLAQDCGQLLKDFFKKRRSELQKSREY